MKKIIGLFFMVLLAGVLTACESYEKLEVETIVDSASVVDNKLTLSGSANLPDGSVIKVVPLQEGIESTVEPFEFDEIITTVTDGKWKTVHTAENFQDETVSVWFYFGNINGSQPDGVNKLVGKNGEGLVGEHISSFSLGNDTKNYYQYTHPNVEIAR